MKVSIYSRRGVRGCGLMGLGPGTDNTTNMLFALLASIAWWLLDVRRCWRTLIGATCHCLSALLSCHQQTSGDRGTVVPVS
ncbi:hypothetical protein Hanom_Chr08g00687921 [Helianthus anomalus]